MIKILIVDDSAFMRKVLSDLLAQVPDVTVSGTARNGKNAIEMLNKTLVDLVVMDVEMPVMDGLSALKIIKQTFNIPVIMLSALSNQEITIEALAAGALDFIEKPTNLRAIETEWVSDFYEKIKSVQPSGLTETTKITAPISKNNQPTPRLLEPMSAVQLRMNTQAVVIGASTGGPKALLSVIQQLPNHLSKPIFIVQHMPKGFTKHFAERMNQEAAVTVVEATDGMLIQNRVYLCPGDYHMTLDRGRIMLNQAPKLHGTRPAVDYLFKSAASLYQAKLTAVLLTGMGKDGADGMVTVHHHGGYNIAQNKETCTVYGMPRSAVEKNVVNEILPLAMIGTKISQIVG
ncbi:two-component system chemotaxis response regulator CheB [Weissella beninensis]|uniref:Protein-glutamate methylesterase/protein-glutamine glutaminase n=1 Tax=Periweissella beninensis TaxID=504936 RepID=A0ABT0VGK0_9LACO|nr:chemotaxis-specific protein-glutamate methyltransferase CheB [Periweissella beninensis]MBM7544715.1 two-component system chemotaxis response regulator CheB [Periweissella beninensis]MCM2436953.1 chemotaxis-specific protein-glutamate methyltransferase CheB [Periweissella beninensis]